MTLRNLNIVSNNPNAVYGVSFDSGAELTVEGCRVSGFNGNGVSVVSISSATRVHVRNSVIRDNSNIGLKLMASSGLVQATVEGTVFDRNAHGVMVLRPAHLVRQQPRPREWLERGLQLDGRAAVMGGQGGQGLV